MRSTQRPSQALRPTGQTRAQSPLTQLSPLGADFVDFAPLDLAGARVGASLKLVF